MKWGQQNQRFGTMRLRGEKMKIKKNKKTKKKRKSNYISKSEIKLNYCNFIKCYKSMILKIMYFIKYFIIKKCSY